MTSSTTSPADLHDDAEWLQTKPGERFAIRTSAGQTGGRFTILEVVADPGTRVPMHIHDREREHVVVREGTLRVVKGCIITDAPAGISLTVSKGAPHAWSNPGDQPVRFLAIFSPGH